MQIILAKSTDRSRPTNIEKKKSILMETYLLLVPIHSKCIGRTIKICLTIALIIDRYENMISSISFEAMNRYERV